MPEQQNIEWKASWRDEYLKWICGFANAKGGVLIIGKDDNGEIIGIGDYKKLMDEIPNKIQNHLGIICDVNLHEINQKHYIEIEVKSQDAPISYQGKYHYRSGSTKQELKGAMLNEFLLKKVGKTWEEALEPDTTINEISIEAVDEFKNEAIRNKRYPLAQSENDLLNLFTNLKLCKDKTLKRSALLIFGKDPRDYLINAFIKIGKFGQSDTELLFQEVIESNAFQMVDKTIEVLDKKYFKRAISYQGINRIETPEYPYEAIREALLNAVIHRNYFGPPIQISIYDDKLMIWNPGLLPEELTLEDLKIKHSSYPRNPLIADVFFKAGLIETWGRGTLKIIETCQTAGLPEPKFEILTGGIVVTFFKDKYSDQFLLDKQLNKRQIKAIKYIKEKSRITNKEYQLLNNCSRNTATNDLKELVIKELLKPSKISGAGSFYELNLIAQ